MTQYIALVHKDDGCAYGVSFPDMPGCIGADDNSMDAAIEDATKALAFHVQGMMEDGDDIPAPRRLDQLWEDPEFKKWAEGAAIVVIPLLSPAGQIQRINITMDRNLVEALDYQARIRGTSRSGLLSLAAQQLLTHSAPAPHKPAPENQSRGTV